MQKYLFKEAKLVNEGKIIEGDLLVHGNRIERIDPQIGQTSNSIEIPCAGKWIFPGVIDDQVHFREPGLTHKANIATESRAAVAGGVTSFMEMPNTIPNALTADLLEDKYRIAAESSAANYSFFMGVSNSNAEEVLRMNSKKKEVCGIKIFMGSSTGNMLVDNFNTLEKIFSETELLIATHCEDETIIKKNLEKFTEAGKTLQAEDHPLIRDEEACYASSLRAVKMAQKYNTRLHILHISTEKELMLFGNLAPLKDKRITAEVCVHHLHFTSEDYARLGYRIKCNPAIKAPHHRDALWEALLDDRLDVIATDHAPHLLEEKQGEYMHAHAGLPLVQHPLLLMLDYAAEGRISPETIARKMSHAVADCFQIHERGYLREGYYADLVLVDRNKPHRVTQESLLYKCGWSPFEGHVFQSSIDLTMVNGKIMYQDGKIQERGNGMRMEFDR